MVLLTPLSTLPRSQRYGSTAALCSRLHPWLLFLYRFQGWGPLSSWLSQQHLLFSPGSLAVAESLCNGWDRRAFVVCSQRMRATARETGIPQACRGRLWVGWARGFGRRLVTCLFLRERVEHLARVRSCPSEWRPWALLLGILKNVLSVHLDLGFRNTQSLSHRSAQAETQHKHRARGRTTHKTGFSHQGTTHSTAHVHTTNTRNPLTHS